MNSGKRKKSPRKVLRRLWVSVTKPSQNGKQAAALDISVAELLSGDYVTNQNKMGNMLRSVFYVCPVCGNVIHTLGKCVVSCCGITLPAQEAEETDDAHSFLIEQVEDESFVTVAHEMSKAQRLSI